VRELGIFSTVEIAENAELVIRVSKNLKIADY